MGYVGSSRGGDLLAGLAAIQGWGCSLGGQSQLVVVAKINEMNEVTLFR